MSGQGNWISGGFFERGGRLSKAKRLQLLAKSIKLLSNDQHIQVGMRTHDLMKEEGVLGKAAHEEERWGQVGEALDQCWNSILARCRRLHMAI